MMRSTRAPTTLGIAVAGCGAVSALGLGVDVIDKCALSCAANSGIVCGDSGLRLSDRLAGYESMACGWVAETIYDSLCAVSQHADARAYLLSHSALSQAVRNSAELISLVPRDHRGLVLSTTKADVDALERTYRGKPCSHAAQRHIRPALLAADLASAFDAQGPVQCVSAACISGLLAIQQGAVLIQRGDADLVFVAGVDLISDFVLSGFSTLKSLDPEGCRPFDRGRIGLSLGEGAGALVLARSDLAGAPEAFVLGWGTSNDANHLTGPSRDGSGLALAIGRALEKGGVAAGEIDYVNAHGTGTPYNDAMESLALRTVFGERVPPFSSAKGLFGHTLGAAGVLEAILCVRALRAQVLPGTPRLRERDPVAPDSIVKTPRAISGLHRIVKMNCGFGGTNAAVVLGDSLPTYAT